MRNLKRALSLVLAAAMLIGMMVVSASAVSYNDFSDRGEIVNKDAVSMLTTLEIIEGKPDGSYAPGENVDRARWFLCARRECRPRSDGEDDLRHAEQQPEL